MGFLQTMRGKPAEGLAWMERAIRLNPFHPDWYHFDRSIALYSLGEYREAAACLDRLPLVSSWASARSAACYAQAGDPVEARCCMQKALREDPAFDPLDHARRRSCFEHEADIDHLLKGIMLALQAYRDSAT